MTQYTSSLTSDQEQLPKNIKNPFRGKKREEPSRRAREEDPSPSTAPISL